jgi:ferric-dicitrate binding protein FerR (iron transport regulator)
MTREQVVDRILNSTEPPMNEAEQLEFRRWLDQKPELRTLFEQQQALFRAMDLWESEAPPSNFDQAVYARIKQDAEARSFWHQLLFASWKPALTAGLAAAALLLGTLVFDFESTQEPTQVAVKSAPEAEYYEEIERALDDMEMLVNFDAFPEPASPGRS